MADVKFELYEKRATRADYVDNINDKYHQQCMRYLAESLKKMQDEQDLIHPGMGGGVALAANQLSYPYKPISSENSDPAPGFYPENYVAPNIYLVHIRAERAERENCEPCEPTFFINAMIISKSRDKLYSGEACPSLQGFHGINVPRYKKIEVFAQNISGNWIRYNYSGFVARVHQHEIDFAQNIEYLDRLSFSEQEMDRIKSWLSNPIVKKDYPIVPEKLLCFSIPDIPALDKWAKKYSHATSPASSFPSSSFQRVIIIEGSQGLGLAWVRYYLRNRYTVIVTHSETNKKQVDALNVFKKKYPDQLTIEIVNLANPHSIDAFTNKVSLQENDLIIYNHASTELFDPKLTMVLTWGKLLKNNILFVNVETHPGDKLKNDAFVKNMNEDNPRSAISVPYDMSPDFYRSNDLFVRNIIKNMIQPTQQSNISTKHIAKGSNYHSVSNHTIFNKTPKEDRPCTNLVGTVGNTNNSNSR
ncbi:MAG: hypothetical protein CK423_09480 [Legionella sp.]|nr:MAG: hypothetical protein CK423_09480 [Legionella sp.]